VSGRGVYFRSATRAYGTDSRACHSAPSTSLTPMWKKLVLLVALGGLIAFAVKKVSSS
jgi:hypothetical protein